MKPLTLQEFFQALADGKTEFFDIEDGKITYHAEDHGFKSFMYDEETLGSVSFNDMVRMVHNGIIALYEKPKRLLTPDDVGKIIRYRLDHNHRTLINSVENNIHYTTNFGNIDSVGKGTHPYLPNGLDIRNDDGTWEEIG